MRCSCLPTYTPGPGPTPTLVCPPECLQAASVIVPTEEGLSCEDVVTYDLTELTDAGNCENVSFSLFNVSISAADQSAINGFQVSVIGSTLSIEHSSLENSYAGEWLTVEYLMNCEDDIRSVVGFIQIKVLDVCLQ